MFSGFPTRFDTNRVVQPQKTARDLKFQILKEEGLYCAADLRLCFCRFSHDAAHLVSKKNMPTQENLNESLKWFTREKSDVYL